MSQAQAPQIFNLNDLTGQEIEAIMVGLNELPAKTSRAVMNKLEAQIVQQVQAMNAMNAMNALNEAKASAAKAEPQPEVKEETRSGK
jgi:hypothetical protein